MKEFDEYRGMSYEAASREGARLIERAMATGRWIDIPERLIHLRFLMRVELSAFEVK